MTTEHSDADVDPGAPGASDDQQLSPAEAAGMGWLDIIRDPSARPVTHDPETPAPPEVRVLSVAQARRQVGPEAVPGAEPEPEAPALSDWATRLRAGALTPTEPTAAEPPDTAPTSADDAAVGPEPDWKTRLRGAAPQPEEVDADPPPPDPDPAPVAVRTLLVPQARRTETQPEPAAPPAADQPAARVTSTSPIGSMPDVHTFKPRRALRTVVTLLFLAGVVVTVLLARDAYADPTQYTVAVTAVAGFVTAVVWALRATTTITRLTVRAGQLEVSRGGGTVSVDLTSRESPLELVGTPGDRGWRALCLRRGQPPFEITPAMVDPVEFTRVVRYHRPVEPVEPAEPAEPAAKTGSSQGRASA